jgi:hypothetical protein
MEMTLTPAYSVLRQPASCRKSFRLRPARIFAFITIPFVLPDLPGSMGVRYVRKTGGCRDFFVSNSKMKIKTETPGFDVIQLYIAYTLIYTNRMTFQ